MIDNSCLSPLATVESDPCIFNSLSSGFDQQSFLNEVLSNDVDAAPIRTASGRIAAFLQNKRRRHQAPALLEQLLVGAVGFGMPLVPCVLGRNQSHRIQEHAVHG